LFSCWVAAGAGGKALVDELSALTGAAVFASDDAVGTVPGADFIWEYRTEPVSESRELFSADALDAIAGLSLSQSWGTALGSFNGVTSYSNGSPGYVSNIYNYINGDYIGMEWQCVEYVRRYYYSVYGVDLYALGGGMNASQFFGKAASMK